MTLQAGSHTIGPENGKLTVSTYVGGMGAKMGHDLVLEAARWRGTVTVDPADPSATTVEVTVDPTSLQILQASGGLKALSDKDKGEIASNSNKTLNTSKHSEIAFRSTGVSGSAPKLKLTGDLTIAGQTRPVTLDVDVQDVAGEARISGKTAVVQSEFGVKPYSKLGALKVKDHVDLAIQLTLPSA
ncbi:MAG: YceI family protein [Acidimicrobiales bacterium]